MEAIQQQLQLFRRIHREEVKAIVEQEEQRVLEEIMTIVDSQELEKVQCLIDTIQVEVMASNMRDIELANAVKSYLDYVTLEGVKAKGEDVRYSYRINLNNKAGYSMITGLTKYEKELKSSFKELQVIKPSDVKLSRIDLAFDTPVDFVKEFKKLLFLFEISIGRADRKEAWYTTNLKTLRPNSIKLHNTMWEVEFYDKKVQSDNRHMFNTRMEFRLKRKSSDTSKESLEKHIDTLRRKLENMEGYLPTLEVDMTKRLKALWEEETASGEVKSLSEFVRKYDKFIYTKTILGCIHAISGCNSSCTNWLREFRRNNKLDLYTKADILRHKDVLLKALKNYKKN